MEKNRKPRAPALQLNLNVRGLPPSATISINDRCSLLRSEGREIVKFGLGQSPFPVPECVVEELRRNAHRKEYLPVKGLPALREAVAGHCRRHMGVDCSAEDVLIGPGSKELMFLLQLVYYGDIVIPTPAWVSYAPQARIIGRHVVFIHSREEDEWRLMPDQLESLCRLDPSRPRIVVLNYPSNPTGRTYTRDELHQLAEIARRFRVVLLSDEIYGHLCHRGEHTSILPLYPEGTILSTGLSKWCGAGGWRLGVFVVPARIRWLVDAMASAASETYTSTSSPIQYAAVRAFDGDPEIDLYLARARRILAALGLHVARRLREGGLHVLDPEGAFYVFIDFSSLREPLAARNILTSRQLCERLLVETGVALLPGIDFGRPEEELTARLAYVDFDGGNALQALARLPEEAVPDEAFLRAVAPLVLKGVEQIRAWLPSARS